LGFIERDLANNKINEKGKVYLDSTNQSVGKGGVGRVSEVSDGGVGKREVLSTHFHKFKLKISSTEKFSMWKLEKLNHQGIKENKIGNLHQTIVTFSDAKIIINQKQVIINLFDIVSENVEETDINALSRAVKYAEILKGVGLETEGIMLEEGHWARVESVLSDFLYEKVDKKYFVTLNDGLNSGLTIHSEVKRMKLILRL
jgi:hypothetical protein